MHERARRYWVQVYGIGENTMRTRWILTLALLLAMLLPGASLAGSMAYNLSPSLDGDDTAEIQEVFTEAAANPGSTIVFAAGDYYLSDTVTAYNLSGSIRGAGSQETVLHTSPGVLFGLTDIPGVGPEGTDAVMAIMFRLFYQVDGLSLDWQGVGWDIEGDPEPYNHAWWGVPQTGMYPIWVEGVGEAPVLNTNWRDIRMTGRERPGFVTAVNLYAHWIRNVGGNHVFQDCHYDTMDYGPALWQVNGATIRIGDQRPQDRVTIRNTWVGVMLGQDVNSSIEIENVRVWREDTPRDTSGAAVQIQASNGNRIHISGLETGRQAGVWMGVPGWVTMPSTLLVEHSTIRPDPTINFAGIELKDWHGGMSDAVIRNNRIMVDKPVYGGPIVLNGTQGVVVTNNTLSGSGPAAVFIGVSDMPARDTLVKGNNVQGWTVNGGLDEPDWHGAAAIWLGEYSTGNTVVGGGRAAETVYDETDNPDTPEYDGANFLSGINSRGGVIGDAVRAGMLQQKEIRDLLK